MVKMAKIHAIDKRGNDNEGNGRYSISITVLRVIELFEVT
jgi:hypothetical protein